MPSCSACNREAPSRRDIFCRHCGARLVQAGGPDPASPAVARAEITDTHSADFTDDLAVFIGKNADRYLGQFRKFSSDGTDSFAVTWHWPAFLFGFWWMLYRKMYLWALASLLLTFIQFVGFVMMIVFGISGNYLYYQHARKRLQELKAGTGPDEDRTAAISKAGGVNNITLILAPLAVIAILAAIAVPQFVAYRQKAADIAAKQEIQDACAKGAALFSSRPDLIQLEPEDLLNAGLVRSPEIEMMMLNGRRDSFSLSAKHKKGRTTYYTDRACALHEKQQPPRAVSVSFDAASLTVTTPRLNSVVYSGTFPR